MPTRHFAGHQAEEVSYTSPGETMTRFQLTESQLGLKMTQSLPMIKSEIKKRFGIQIMLNIIMLSNVMLNVIMLGVVMLSAIMLSTSNILAQLVDYINEANKTIASQKLINYFS